MSSPKHQLSVLRVKAVGLVRHVDTDTGRIQQNMSFVGRDAQHQVKQDGEVVGYHPFYINELKQGALLPLDLATAQLAGVKFQ